MTKIGFWFIAARFLYTAFSNASDTTAYEYLPQIPVPALRKIIGEYAQNILMYRVKFFTALPFGCANTDAALPYATIKCITSGGNGRWDNRRYSIIVIPENKQIPAMHIDCHEENSNKLLVPPALQSDSKYNETYTTFLRYKSYKHFEPSKSYKSYEEGEDRLRVIFAKARSLDSLCRLDGQYDCIECVPDDTTQHNARKAANNALQKARFVFEE